MRTMKKWQLLALGAFVTGLGAIGVMSRHTAKAAFVEAPNHHLRFQFDWPRGQKETYALTWRATSETSLVGAGLGVPGAGALKGDVDLEGDLVVESFGARDGGYLLRERVENLRRPGAENHRPACSVAGCLTANCLLGKFVEERAAEIGIFIAMQLHRREAGLSGDASYMVHGLVDEYANPF